MSSGTDELFISLGVMLAVGSLAAIFRPETLVNESRRNRDARLREIDAGAPERFLDERRALEAYPPRFDLSHRTLRLLGAVGLVLGLLCIFNGLNR